MRNSRIFYRLLGMLVGGPFWGMIADKWHCHRTAIVVMCLTSVVSMCTQPLITIQYGNPIVNRCPYAQGAYHKPNVSNCASALQNCSFKAANFQNETVSTHQTTDFESNKLFYIMMFIYIMVAFFEGSAVAFVDAATIRKVQLSKYRKIDYGKQRMWSAFGAAVGNVSTNLIIEYFPTSKMTCYSGIFITYALYTIMFTIALLYLYKDLSFEDQDNSQALLDLKVQDKPQMYKTIFKTVCKFDVALLYVSSFIAGCVYSPYANFFFLYLKDLGGSPTLFSLTIPAAALGSVLGFFFSMKMIKFLGGTWKAISISFLAYVVRLSGIGLVQNPWLVLLFQPLHSLTYCLLLTAGVTHLKETSPVSVITTMVSIFMSLHFGVGPLVGSVISGIVYTMYGGRKLFIGASLFALCWFLLIVVYIVVNKKRSKGKGLIES